MLDQYKTLLAELIAIKSVSTNAEFKPEMKRAVEWLQNLFELNHFNTQIFKEYGNPIFFAEHQADPRFETCLIYGHYDVQPAYAPTDVGATAGKASKTDWQIAGWNSDPFKLTERAGRLYARGVVDNKGQVLIHMLTIFNLIRSSHPELVSGSIFRQAHEDKQALKHPPAGQAGVQGDTGSRLGYNIKFIIEGDEETGSAKLETFIKDHKELLRADFALISDGEFGEFPTIEAGFRGGFNCTLTVKTSHTDLHSGVYGTGAPNAAHELVKFLATFYDEEHRILIKDFYNDVDEIDEQIKKMHASLPFDHKAHQELTGVKKVLTEPGYDFYTQTSLRPTIQVTGLSSGYAGAGYRNSIAGQARAKINFRLVKSQNPETIARLFEEHIKLHLPDWAAYELEFNDFHEGVKLNLDNKYSRAVADSMEKSHGLKPMFKFCGGGLPVVTHFDQILGIPTLSVSLGNEDCRMHAANENFRLDYIEKGLKFSEMFFSK